MKKLILTTAIILMVALVSSQAKAELLMLTAANGTQFNYDPSGAVADSLIVGSSIPDDGLNDFAIFLGFRPTDGSTVAPVELTGGTNVTAPGTASNRGSIQFDPVTLDNGVSVSALATFRLSEVSSANAINGLGATVLYDLELTTSGVAAAPGALQSLVGFDFNDIPNSDRDQSTEIISGFGSSNVSIGDVNGADQRVLSGGFNFPDFTDDGRAIAANNLFVDDPFNGLIGDNLDRFSNFAAPAFSNPDGDLGFSAFSDFQLQANDGTFVTAGVGQFRSTVASNITSTIPEPSTLLMASMGLGMVAFRRRRKQQA